MKKEVNIKDLIWFIWDKTTKELFLKYLEENWEEKTKIFFDSFYLKDEYKNKDDYEEDEIDELIGIFMEKKWYINIWEKEQLDFVAEKKLSDFEKEERFKKIKKIWKLKNNNFIIFLITLYDFLVFVTIVSFAFILILTVFIEKNFILLIPFLIYLFVLNSVWKRLYKKTIFLDQKLLEKKSFFWWFKWYHFYFKYFSARDKKLRWEKRPPSAWWKFFEILGLYLILRFIWNSIFKK